MNGDGRVKAGNDPSGATGREVKPLMNQNSHRCPSAAFGGRNWVLSRGNRSWFSASFWQKALKVALKDSA